MKKADLRGTEQVLLFRVHKAELWVIAVLIFCNGGVAIFFYMMTILFAVSWLIAMKQEGVGEVSRQAIRKFNFHMKSKASQSYLEDDEVMNPNMKDINLKERNVYDWVIPFVVVSTVFFIISIIIGFLV